VGWHLNLELLEFEYGREHWNYGPLATKDAVHEYAIGLLVACGRQIMATIPPFNIVITFFLHCLLGK
jgi:hypothetical protein